MRLDDLVTALQRRYGNNGFAKPQTRSEAINLLTSGPPSEEQKARVRAFGQEPPIRITTYDEMVVFLSNLHRQVGREQQVRLPRGTIIRFERKLWEVKELINRTAIAPGISIKPICVTLDDKGELVVSRDSSRRVLRTNGARFVHADILSDAELLELAGKE